MLEFGCWPEPVPLWVWAVLIKFEPPATVIEGGDASSFAACFALANVN